MSSQKTQAWGLYCLINWAPKRPNASALAAGYVGESMASQPQRVLEGLQGPSNSPLLNMTMYYGLVSPSAQLRNRRLAETGLDHGVEIGIVGG